MPRRLRFAVLCLPAGSLLLLSGSHLAQATTLEEYRSLVVDCRRVAEKKKPADAEITRLRARLLAVTTVTYPGGGTVTVNTRPLVAALRRYQGSDSTSERFATLENLLTAAERGQPQKGDPRRLADQVLSDKEFNELRNTIKPAKDLVPNWWVRFSNWSRETLERLSQWLNNLFRDRRTPNAPDLTGVRAFVRFLQFVLYFALAAAALVVVYLFARIVISRGWFSGLRRRRKRGGDPELPLDLSGDGIPDPLGAARALAAQGAYREAVRMAYIASLRRLQENGLLVLESNKTNWEYQRDIRRRSRAASDTLLSATRLFDRVWYGRRPASAEEFAEAVRVHDALQNLGNQGSLTDDSLDGQELDVPTDKRAASETGKGDQQ